MKVETTEWNNKSYTKIQVSRIDSKNKILDITDLVSFNVEDPEKNFEKVCLSMTEYGEGKESVHVRHFMELDDFLVLAKEIVDEKPVKLVEYKGSKNSKYSTGYESRVFGVGYWAEGFKGEGGYKIQISCGPGVVGDKGQVSPAKEGQRSVSMVIPVPEAKRAFLYAATYFQAKMSAFISNNLKLFKGS